MKNQSHAAASSVGANYRFDTFNTGLLLKDMKFGRRAPRLGDRLPDFELSTPDGQVVRAAIGRQSFWRRERGG